MERNRLTTYKPVADTIKLAILQGQYEAAKGVNRIQLAVYFGIGKFISLNTRRGKWGTGALESISQILRKELPWLRGFSATQLREMRLFMKHGCFLTPIHRPWPMNLKSKIWIADYRTAWEHFEKILNK